MTSISFMEALCPACGTDVRQQVVEAGIGFGDSEDVVEVACPGKFCGVELEIELVCAFKVMERL